MSSQEYNSGRYIMVDEGFKHLGFTTDQKSKMSEEQRGRYINWIKEANNNIEAQLSMFSDVLPLEKTSQEFSFAKSAALNWLVYKKRDLAGSSNAKDAKNDYDRDIANLIELLKKRPTTKTYPIFTDHSDSTEDIIIPYSQTLGFPPDIIY